MGFEKFILYVMMKFQAKFLLKGTSNSSELGHFSADWVEKLHRLKCLCSCTPSQGLGTPQNGVWNCQTTCDDESSCYFCMCEHLKRIRIRPFQCIFTKHDSNRRGCFKNLSNLPCDAKHIGQRSARCSLPKS